MGSQKGAYRLLTWTAGAVMLGCSLGLLGYAVGADEPLNGLGWIVVVVFLVGGVVFLRRAATWDVPVYCLRCGEPLRRETVVCPRCGFDREKATWAAMGELKVP
jgi:hypothetical protein